MELKAQAVSILKDAIQKIGFDVKDSELFLKLLLMPTLQAELPSGWQAFTDKIPRT